MPYNVTLDYITMAPGAKKQKKNSSETREHTLYSHSSVLSCRTCAEVVSDSASQSTPVWR